MRAAYLEDEIERLKDALHRIMNLPGGGPAFDIALEAFAA
jgi:hypothetical protein